MNNEERDAAEKAPELSGDLLLASFIDELRSPLQSIVGSLDLMSVGNLDQEQQALLTDAKRSFEHTNQIIDRLASYIDLASTTQVPALTTINLSQLLQDTLSLIRSYADVNNIGIDLIAADSLPTHIIGDLLRIKEVLVNLLMNAIKDADKTANSEGQVTLEVFPNLQSTKSMLGFIVRNDSPEIPTDFQDKIYEAHERGPAIATIARSGLGLSIARHLVTLMHGTITVDSSAEAGSRFTVEVPIYSSHIATSNVATSNVETTGVEESQPQTTTQDLASQESTSNSLDRAVGLLDKLSELLGSATPIGVGQVFLTVGAHAASERLQQNHLPEKLGISRRSISRHLRYLGFAGTEHKLGLNLVTTQPSVDRRNLRLGLTDAGLAAIREIETILQTSRQPGGSDAGPDRDLDCSIVLTDPAGRFIWGNEAFFELSGYLPEEMLDKNPGALLQGKLTDQRDLEILRTAISQRKYARTQLINYHKDGSPYRVDLNVAPISYKGEFIGYLSTAQEISVWPRRN